MKIGYARVSPHDQTRELQHEALREAGCEQVFTDVCNSSVACAERPQLQRAAALMRDGEIARMTGVSQAALYRHFTPEGRPRPAAPPAVRSPRWLPRSDSG